MHRFKSASGMRQIYDSYNRLLEAWNIPVEERDIETSYGKTHLISAGDSQNPPLLLFHGTADNSAMMWIYNAKALAEHFMWLR
ncbi:hypothetical protein [Marinicrinis lubricantis]|uniref:Peptidase S9 prolyl oligopeptidase catalytic domain-containing protein n=1 Tax=Marinicrinis lubricantis TaxID=2086470 RepID=A0ABW1IRS1_9BACL